MPGFRQARLAKGSHELTTFVTPAGWYCYQCLPFGSTSATEYFQRQISQILEGQEDVPNMIDGALVFVPDKRQHHEKLQQVLDRLERAGVMLNKGKCEHGITTVKFLGVLVKPERIYLHPSKMQAITEMAFPEDMSMIWRLWGMVNHKGRSLSNVSRVTVPIRPLLGKSALWMWGLQQQCATEEKKVPLTSGQGVGKCYRNIQQWFQLMLVCMDWEQCWFSNSHLGTIDQIVTYQGCYRGRTEVQPTGKGGTGSKQCGQLCKLMKMYKCYVSGWKLTTSHCWNCLGLRG